MDVAAEQQTTTLREQQSCPEWCEGSDHAATWQEFGEPGSTPEHFGYVAGGQRWDVVVTASVPHGGAGIRVTVREDGGSTNADLPSVSVARSVAAAITRAADLVEFGLTAVSR